MNTKPNTKPKTTHQLSVPDIFAEALDLAPEEREAYLQRACAGDQEAYREVKSLLGEHSHAQDFLEHSALSIATRAMSREVTPLLPGTRLGRYEIIREIGAGGMGDVFQARDDIGLEVAIKVLPDYFAQDPERVSRFESEARKMAQLNHPHIASIHGREVMGGWRFLVLEYVNGETLETRLERGPLPVREALSIFGQIADALAATHHKDIVHRDLKPSNIMLTHNGNVKLLDFGIAKHFRHEETDHTVSRDSMLSTLTQSLTSHGFTPGTLPYMSPEQRIGGKTDQATDLWAFGVVLYEALTGHHPFRRDTREETSMAIVNFTPNWQLLPDATPPVVREMLKRCLTKDPTKRLREAEQAHHILTTARQDMDRSFDLLHWWQQIRQRFSRRLVLNLACGLALVAAFLGWRWYENHTLRLAVMQPSETACQPVPHQELVARLKSLRRIRADVGAATDQDKLQLHLAPQCADNKTLLTLVTPEGLTVFAQFAPNLEQAVKRLEPVLDASLSRLTADLEPQNVQMNLVLPVLPNMQPEEERLLDLDQWDNLALLDSTIKLVEKLIAEKGDSAALQAALSRAHTYRFLLSRDLADRNKAYNAYHKALTLNPDSPEANLAAGDFYTALGEEEAIKYFRATLAKKPYDAEALRGLGRAYENAGHDENAEAAYSLSVILRPQYWGGYNELGAFYLGQQQYELAEIYLRSAKQLVDNPVVLNNLGGVYFYQGRLTEAFAAYEDASKRAPRVDTYINLGLIRYAEGNFSAATKYLEQAKEKYPDEAEAWGFYGQALHWLPNRSADSQAALRRAIELTENQLQNNLAPTQKAYTTALQALWQAILGQHQDALQAINPVLPKPDSEQVRDHHGVIEQAIVIFHLAQQDELALTWVEQYLKTGGKESLLAREPFLAPLRSDPRYRRLIDNYPRK